MKRNSSYTGKTLKQIEVSCACGNVIKVFDDVARVTCSNCVLKMVRYQEPLRDSNNKIIKANAVNDPEVKRKKGRPRKEK